MNNFRLHTIVFTFGRYNPPSIGHERLFNFTHEIARQNNIEHRVYPSHSHDNKKNPLTFDLKLKYLEFFFPDINFWFSENIKTVFNVLQDIDEDGYEKVILIAGEDRVQEFEKVLIPYVTKEKYPKETNEPAFKNIKELKILSAGHRDPDSDGVEGMSASKLREFAIKDDIDSFRLGVPSCPENVDGITYEDTVESMFIDIRKGMGLD